MSEQSNEANPMNCNGLRGTYKGIKYDSHRLKAGDKHKFWLLINPRWGLRIDTIGDAGVEIIQPEGEPIISFSNTTKPGAGNGPLERTLLIQAIGEGGVELLFRYLENDGSEKTTSVLVNCRARFPF